MTKKWKRGKAYEAVVAEVLRSLEPNASVAQGKWVVGPDGRRELDVIIEGQIEGQVTRIVVECKDYNPHTTGPVGIGVVDELESKMRDVGATSAMICANTGFTGPAIKKAKRVGIGLIAVMKKDDRRIRSMVVDDFYFRKVKFQEVILLAHSPHEINLSEHWWSLTLRGQPLGNWVLRRLQSAVQSSLKAEGTLTITMRFLAPEKLEWTTGVVQASAITVKLLFTGNWYVQSITIDAEHGIYDWLRRSIRVGLQPNTVRLDGLDFDRGTLMTDEMDFAFLKAPVGRHETSTGTMTVFEQSFPDDKADFESLIHPDDLSLEVEEGTP